MTKILLALAATALLSGCGSGTPSDSPPPLDQYQRQSVELSCNIDQFGHINDPNSNFYAQCLADHPGYYSSDNPAP